MTSYDAIIIGAGHNGLAVLSCHLNDLENAGASTGDVEVSIVDERMCSSEVTSDPIFARKFVKVGGRGNRSAKGGCEGCSPALLR